MSKSYHYPTPEEIEVIRRDAVRMRNAAVASAIRSLWRTLSGFARHPFAGLAKSA